MKNLIYIPNIKKFNLCDEMSNPKGKSCIITDYKISKMPHQYFTNNIIIYGRNTCPYCQKTIKYFQNLDTNINDKVIFIELENDDKSIFPKNKFSKEFTHNTVPMVYYKKFLGGYDDIKDKPINFWN
jgi:glutaredoxin